MVTLVCAIVGAQGSAFLVDIKPDGRVGDLKNAIADYQKFGFAANMLQLFLAKKNNGKGTWLTEKEVQEGVSDTSDLNVLGAAGASLKLVGLSEEDVKFEPTLEDVKSMKTPVHVLVVLPTIDLKRPAEYEHIILKRLETMEHKLSAIELKTLTDDQHPRKKARSLRDISNEIPYIFLNLDINTWTVGGIDLNIYKVESDFPKWFYVREETLNIAAVFTAQLGVGRHVVCLGALGVGKSMLVVVYAFFMALIERKRVVLFRKKKGEGYTMLYLDVENNQYWRKDEAAIEDIADLENREFELCLDGFTHDDVNHHFGTLERFRLLATSVQYPTKDDDSPVLRRCLVPFWSLSDLNKIGEYCQWPDHEIKDRYFYSGGNLRDFLLGTKASKDAINAAVQSVGTESAKLFKTQYGITSVRQVDRLRMTGIQENDYQDVDKYMLCDNWVCVITSEYALRQLSKIVELSYYQDLWEHAKQLGDDGLMGIAFENCVHTLARDGKKIMLRVRTYDREKEKEAHTYEDLDIEPKLCRSDAKDTAECDAAMKRFATSSDDYWYPSCRALETIDCVARLNMDGQSNVVLLIQITKSNTHSIASTAINKYAKFLSNRCVYIALVPDKQTCDAFRLAPVSPATKVPLKVAYFKKFPQLST